MEVLLRCSRARLFPVLTLNLISAMASCTDNNATTTNKPLIEHCLLCARTLLNALHI